MSVLITGANRGIGLALTRQYLQQGFPVLATCRRPTDELQQLGQEQKQLEIISGIDVTKPEAITELKNKVGDRKLQILINNAGVLEVENLENLDFQTMQFQFEVNALAPLRVTQALLPNLDKGSKIAFITSRMGSIEDNGSGGWYGYRASKAALNMFGKTLAVDLKKEREIPVAILHPGRVKTRMIGFEGDVTPEQAAEGLIKRIEGLNLENTGTFWHANGEVLPW